MFRRRKRCQNLDPSPHPSYRGRQCELPNGHDGVCEVKVGAYKHYWRQEFHERLGRGLRKEEA